MKIQETLAALQKVSDFSLPPTLDRMRKLMAALGDPQNRLQTVHVAGTNGKGSTCTMTAACLQAAGYRVGLYTSPYVLSFFERIQVNGQPIGADDLCRLYEAVCACGVTVSAFEAITAIAFCRFAEQNCTAVVLETGLGGRFDATNLIEHPAVTAVTAIGLDHTAVLGPTLAAIAAEKAGIFKNGTPAVSAAGQKEEALAVLQAARPDLILPHKEWLSEVSVGRCGNRFCYRGVPYETRLGGRYQVENALTALTALSVSGFAVPQQALQKGLSAAVIPARCEVLTASPLTVLDGAHNPAAAAALAAEMQAESGRIVAIVGMMKDKDADGVLSQTLRHCRAVVAVAAAEGPRALSAAEMADRCRRYADRVFTADSVAKAAVLARQIAGNDPVFCFGSLYLAAQYRQQHFAGGLLS